MYVSPQTFDKHLRFLTRYYQAVTMEQLMVWCKQPENTRRPLCIITFDDGWSDNYYTALPLLRKYGCPATLFVATDFIGTGQTPWFYRLSDILHAHTVMPKRNGEILRAAEQNGMPPVLRQWLEASDVVKRQLLDTVIEALKALQPNELEQVIEQLAELLCQAGQSIKDNGEEVMLDWQQVQELHASNVEIGSHTCSHMILTRLPREVLEAELKESKRLIENRIQRVVQGFCYPNGDFNDQVERLVQDAGYTYACTAHPGYVEPHDMPYQLKRIGVHDDITFSTALFACHVAGIFKRQ